MAKLDEAKALAYSYFDEVEATIEIRQSYNSIIISQASTLFLAFASDSTAKQNLNRALKHKSSDPSALYKPLIVQIHGIFENYTKSMVKAIIEDRFETVERYSCLNKEFRNHHISYAANVLKHLKTGTLNGASYNFESLLSNLGKSLTDQKSFKLNSEIYTKLMGNCTPERLEALFKSLSLPDLFSDKLGQNTDLKKFFNESAKGRVAQRSKDQLKEAINFRNEIVHGELTRAVSLDDLKETLAFFRALISAIDQLVR